MARPNIWHRKIYVHSIQRKYLYLSLVPLIVCSLAIILLTFLPMQLLLTGRASELDKAMVASCLSALGSRLWPAIFLSMLLAAILSVFASHALGGPLYRLEAIGKRLAAGEFIAPIRVREGDDLQGMAAVLDQAVGTLRHALVRIREQEGVARERLGALQGELAAGQVPAAALSGRLQEIAAQLEGIEETLGPFQI
ncbi:MAG: methyl-accepting chemotaxis protein [candidate division NC10 bacterium]|nr:methyl-accepting chemotaxis protein [candidate division NC10 bacterium]